MKASASTSATPVRSSTDTEWRLSCGIQSPMTWVASPRASAHRRDRVATPTSAPVATCIETITVQPSVGLPRRGGLGATQHALQSYMGHGSIQVTFDLYGKLMPGNEDEAARLLDSYLARASERLLNRTLVGLR